MGSGRSLMKIYDGIGDVRGAALPMVCGNTHKRRDGEWEERGGLNAPSRMATALHLGKMMRGSFLHVTLTEGDSEFSLSSL